jgi:general secretion pathway protein C
MAVLHHVRKLDALAPWILTLTIFWICWQLARIFWLIAAPAQAPIAREIMLGGGQQASIPNVTGFMLFKEQRPDLSPAAVPVVSVPMQLEGVFVGRPMARSAAVIRVNNLSKHYRVGQKIEEAQLELVAVDWNKVTFKRADGQQATLKFGQQGLDQAPSASTMLATPSAQTPAQQVDRALSDAISQLSSNPAAYLTRMGVMATGQGYEITPNVPAEMRSQLGLRPGDRIVSVNGQTLGQPQNDAQLLEQVRQQRRAQIEIQRGDQTMTIQQSF